MIDQPADNSAIERLVELLDASRRGVVFTGAGISTESGIPDFRSPGGIWEKYRPIEFGEFMASEQARCEYWQRQGGGIVMTYDPRLAAALGELALDTFFVYSS